MKFSRLWDSAMLGKTTNKQINNLCVLFFCVCERKRKRKKEWE